MAIVNHETLEFKSSRVTANGIIPLFSGRLIPNSSALLACAVTIARSVARDYERPGPSTSGRRPPPPPNPNLSLLLFPSPPTQPNAETQSDRASVLLASFPVAAYQWRKERQRRHERSLHWCNFFLGARRRGRVEVVGRSEEKAEKVVADGSEIRELVEDREAFGTFVESKFRRFDADGDGRLSLRELHPAVADIGAALGLPAQGSSPIADHIDSEVMSEFTHGKQEEVSSTEFQEVLSDILLGMAAGLKRDPIVILRIDGEDLRDFVDSPRYELEAAAIFSQIGSEAASLRQCLLAALHQLNVDHGMPPASDPWVVGNVIEPALQQLSANQLEQPASQDVFFEQLKKLLGNIIERLQEQPVIVAHTENTFDASGVKRLLANKFELDKLLDSVWKDVPIEHKNKASKEYLRVALDKMADATSLPPYGAVNQVDAVVNEAFKMANADDGKAVDEAEFKKLLTDVLGAVMLQLNGDPIFVSTNTVVHEPLSSSSTLLSSPSVTSTPSE